MFLKLIIAILVFILLFYIVILMNSNMVVEGMTTTTEECLAKGYTKEFCLQNPMVGSCLCPDGSMGIVIPGFKGECVCGNSYLF